MACSTGDTLAKEQVEATGKEDVLKALSRASSSLRAKLGESLPSVQKLDVPIEATTSSLEALKNYSMGITVRSEKGDAPAIPFFKRAIELDPNFPMAYAALSVVYGDLQQRSLALEYASKAYQMRDRATEREKLRITAAYFHATGEAEKQAQTYEMWVANYPRDGPPHNNLGLIYANMGQYDKALVEYQEAGRLGPDSVVNYMNLGLTYLWLNRLDEAKAVFDQALAHKLDGGLLRQVIYYFAFLRGVALASLVLHGAPANKAVRFAATLPGMYGITIAFVAKLAISFILMSAILFALNHEFLEPYTHYVSAILVATYIAFESPLSGMSTNPARTFGPALYARYWHALWIYFTAPPLGMLAAAQLLLTREGKGPYCAKLHHRNNKRCIFHHSGPDAVAAAKQRSDSNDYYRTDLGAPRRVQEFHSSDKPM